MKRRIAILAIAALTIFIMGCPMPQLGKAPTRDLTGGGDTSAAPVTGSISVVNDEARGQAVYTNETGQRFDVVAEEYPGGPLVKCVDVADFSLVPPSADSDALPLKALVAGMRDDGTPGVWEINSDDTITLPQPEVTADNTARCIIGGDMATLPGSVQLRYGWKFTVDSMSADGQMIVGHAVNSNGVVIGGVSIPAGSTIGVYWRAYTPPFTRFVIVSAPRVIGTFIKPPLPARWMPDQRRFTAILSGLKQFFLGTLEAYLTLPDKVLVQRFGNFGNYSYLVKGIDEFGDQATALIDKAGNCAILEVPDLTMTSVSVSGPGTGGQYSVSATVLNNSAGAATGYTISYSLNQAGTSPVVIATTVNTTGLAGMASATDTQTFTPVASSVPYTVTATVTDVPQDNEHNTSNNSLTSGPFTVASAVVVTVYPEIILDTYVPTAANAGLMTGVDALDLYSLNGGILQLIASDHSQANNPDPDASRFAYIDYKGGLTSGTYYIRVESIDSSNSTNMGAYAIRVLTAPDAQPRNSGWYFGSDNTADAALSYKILVGANVNEVALSGSSYEPDDGGPPAVMPLASMSIDWALNRYLGSSKDVDWIVLTLP